MALALIKAKLSPILPALVLIAFVFAAIAFALFVMSYSFAVFKVLIKAVLSSMRPALVSTLA